MKNGIMLPVILLFAFKLQADTTKIQAQESTLPEPGVNSSCSWFSKKKPWAHCKISTEGSANPDVLYYLHGAGGSEKKWMTHFKPIRDAWKKLDLQPPIVISISFGPVWALTEKNGSPASGLFTYLVNTVMPYIENELGGVYGRRILMGESMGGFNVTQLIMRSGYRFSQAAILCPAITAFSPYSPKKAIEAYQKRTGATLASIAKILTFQKIFYSTQESWFAGSPLHIGKVLFGPLTPPLYISGASADEYGFLEGSTLLAQLARTQGVPNVQFEVVEGDHCTYNPTVIAKFLVQ